MATFHELTTAQLRHALQLREQIESLQKQLASLLGGSSVPAAKPAAAPATPGRKKGKRTMSPEAREKIAAAARARWARAKGGKAPAKAAKVASAKAPVAKTVPKPAKPGKKIRLLTPEGRARLASAMKARWAARKAANAS